MGRRLAAVATLTVLAMANPLPPARGRESRPQIDVIDPAGRFPDLSGLTPVSVRERLLAAGAQSLESLHSSSREAPSADVTNSPSITSAGQSLFAGDFFIAPAGDFDSDLRPDALAVDFRSIQGRVVVEALNGEDGAKLWSFSEPSDLAYAIPTDVGESEPGALLFSYTYQTADASAGYGGLFELNVVSLSNGGEIWRRTFTGYILSTLLAVAGYGLPFPAGLMNAVPGSAADILIGRLDITDAFLTHRFILQSQVLDGEDGHTLALFWSEPQAELIYAIPAADLNGDSFDDFFVVEFDPLGRVHARSGVTGALLWTSEVSVNPVSIVIPVGDLNRDGKTETAITTPGFESSVASIVDGSGQGVLWSRSAATARAAGDINGDGYAEVALQSPFLSASSAGISYDAVDHLGNVAYSVSHSVPFDPDHENAVAMALYPDLGDVDGDGFNDSAHSLRIADFTDEVFRNDKGVVSGSSGIKLWTGRPAEPLNATVDGAGFDLAALTPSSDSLQVEAVDGASGITIWTKTLPGQRNVTASAVGADFTGDGRAEVLVNSYSAELSNGSAFVLNGLDGAILWNGEGVGVVPRVENRRYVALAGDLATAELDFDCGEDEMMSVGGTCFRILGGERTVALSLNDQVADDVAGFYRFYDAAAATLSEGSFCNTSAAIDVPPYSASLYLWVLTASSVDVCSGGSIPTSGTASAEFD